MADEPKRPKIRIERSDFSNNRRHGIAVGKGAEFDMDISDTNARENAGSGLHLEGEESDEVSEDQDRRWSERPIGIVLLAVIAMGIAYYLGFT